MSLPLLPTLHIFTRDAEGNQTGESPGGLRYERFSPNPVSRPFPKGASPDLPAESSALHFLICPSACGFNYL